MKPSRKFFLTITLLLALIIGTFAFYLPQAAAAPTNSCVKHKSIQNWNNANQLSAQGFYPELFETGTMSFANGDLNLNLGTTPNNTYSAARISETDNRLPVAERVKCWQPTANKSVVATLELKLDQPSVFLTENFFFWNAPYGPTGSIPLTAIGVTRSAGSGGQYAAIVAQDVVMNPDMSLSGYLNVMPMPTWLNPTETHSIRITISQTNAVIEVSQGEHGWTTVLDAQLPHAPEALGFEYSVDNELFPGYTIPVYVPDAATLGPLDISLK